MDPWLAFRLSPLCRKGKLRRHRQTPCLTLPRKGEVECYVRLMDHRVTIEQTAPPTPTLSVQTQNLNLHWYLCWVLAVALDDVSLSRKYSCYGFVLA